LEEATPTLPQRVANQINKVIGRSDPEKIYHDVAVLMPRRTTPLFINKYHFKGNVRFDMKATMNNAFNQKSQICSPNWTKYGTITQTTQLS
jgi:hypothetical protein